MSVRLPDAAASAYRFPLLIKHLLRTALATASAQTIVYSDRHRYTYAEFSARVGRLATALAGLGVQPGTTVAVLDWDSHRYLECYFAVPMMGAVLQWVSSLRLEEIIASHPEVAEVAVIAVPHARWGERPHALVVPRPMQGAALRPQDILEYIGQHIQQGAIPRYAMPDRVVIVERLEKTTVGKIDKRALRERYRGRQ